MVGDQIQHSPHLGKRRSQTPEYCPVPRALRETLHHDAMIQKALQAPRHLRRSTANGWGFVWLLASHFSEIACVFWLQESELLRLKAFILFGKLAQVVRISKKHFFKQEVKKAWVPLMLHCQDPCSDAAQVRHTWALCAMPRACCPHKEHVLRGCRPG